MSTVSIDSLKRGMVINSDVFSKKGSLLLYKGFTIENPNLVSIVLQRNGITSVEIKDEQPFMQAPTIKESNSVQQKIQEEVTQFKEEFTEMVDTLEQNIEDFKETKDINTIKDLKNPDKFARESDKYVLTIFQLVEIIRNEGTNEYSDILQVSLLSYSIGKWIELNEEELKTLSQVAILKGVFAVSGIDYTNKDSIKGIELVGQETVFAALACNERSDCSGPMGLNGGEIPLYSRIVAIADVFYTLTSRNELGEKLSVFDAIKIMQREYLPILDTKILYIFLHRIASKYIGSTIRLSDGTEGIIVFVPENEVAFPFVKTSDGNVINLQNPIYKNNKIIEIL